MVEPLVAVRMPSLGAQRGLWQGQRPSDRRPRRIGIVLVLAAGFSAGAQCSSTTSGGQEQDQSGFFKGRKIANVMSFHGAPWLEREGRASEENTEKLVSLLPISPGATVADFGCGSGFYARRMARVVGDSGKVLCADIQPEMLEIAADLARREGTKNIETVLAAANDPHLPVAGVDLILIVDVYHELSDPAAVLAQLRKALRPEGIVALVEFRLEGETAAHIKADHRMSVEQVLKEWVPAGFELVRQEEGLPIQHLFLFRATPNLAPAR